MGIAIFFTPIACTIIVDIIFYVTTVQIINRMNTYGRIHHKLKEKLVLTCIYIQPFLLPHKILQFRYVRTNADRDECHMAVAGLLLVGRRRTTLHEHHVQRHSGAAFAVHLRTAPEEREILAEEVVLLQ